LTPPASTPRRRRPPLAVRLARVVVGFALIVSLVLVAGFFLFISTIPRAEPATAGLSGDGIVVLTGAADRISEATDLLAAGRAKRLLISGVNPQTNRAELAKLHPGSRRWLECCTDLDRRALNTAGNALETRKWVRRNGFESIIVVTSGWHMRRSLLELERLIPEVILLPYPVVTGNASDEAWWREPSNLRLLVAEYVKYLAALIEVRFAPRVADPEPAKAQ